MKSNLTYPLVFSFVACLYFTLLSLQESPEVNIVGEWREVSWQYEKLDTVEESGASLDYMLTDQIKNQISKDLIIHKAETWRFAENETLEMTGSNSSKSIHWNLKGRGNILQLKGPENTVEHYQIQELSLDRMVLHFSFDMQVKGIVKMTFERINT